MINGWTLKLILVFIGFAWFHDIYGRKVIAIKVCFFTGSSKHL